MKEKKLFEEKEELLFEEKERLLFEEKELFELLFEEEELLFEEELFFRSCYLIFSDVSDGGPGRIGVRVAKKSKIRKGWKERE